MTSTQHNDALENVWLTPGKTDKKFWTPKKRIEVVLRSFRNPSRPSGSFDVKKNLGCPKSALAKFIIEKCFAETEVHTLGFFYRGDSNEKKHLRVEFGFFLPDDIVLFEFFFCWLCWLRWFPLPRWFCFLQKLRGRVGEQP